MDEELYLDSEEILLDEDELIEMAELFKMFGDSTRIKILCGLFAHAVKRGYRFRSQRIKVSRGVHKFCFAQLTEYGDPKPVDVHRVAGNKVGK